MTSRLRLSFAVVLVLLGCGEATAPFDEQALARPQLEVLSPPELHILHQSPTAPRLATYRVSFWARRGTQTTVSVHYRLAPGQTRRDEFLRFRIPINGLVAGAGGVPLERGDSVRITLTIDSVLFSVDFQPSGVAFSRSSPAQLGIWYKNADPDFNGDGVVDAADQALEEQLAIWTRENRADAWKQLTSGNNTTEKVVTAALRHFSSYSVSW